jgi:hypothetical protein
VPPCACRARGVTQAAEAQDGAPGGNARAGGSGSIDGVSRPPPARQSRRAEASLVLVDRTLDLATAARHSGNIMARVLAALPRAGAGGHGGGGDDGGSALAAAHLHEVTLQQPAYDVAAHPPPAAAAAAAAASFSRRRLHNERAPYPALANFPWKAPPSICHISAAATGNGAGNSASANQLEDARRELEPDAEAEAAAWALASLPEAAGHAVLSAALHRALAASGRAPPPPRKRGMGAEVFAAVAALASGSGGGGGGSGDGGRRDSVRGSITGNVDVSSADLVSANARRAAQRLSSLWTWGQLHT